MIARTVIAANARVFRRAEWTDGGAREHGHAHAPPQTRPDDHGHVDAGHHENACARAQHQIACLQACPEASLALNRIHNQVATQRTPTRLQNNRLSDSVLFEATWCSLPLP